MVSQVIVHDVIPRSWWQEQLRIDIVIPKQEDVVGNRDRLTDILEWLQSFANSNTHSPTRTVFWSFPSSSTNCRPNIHINEPLGTTLIQAVIFFYSFLSRWEVLWHSSVTMAHVLCAEHCPSLGPCEIDTPNSGVFTFYLCHQLPVTGAEHMAPPPLPCPYIIYYLYHHLKTMTCWMRVLCTFMMNLLGAPIQISLKYGLDHLSH